MVLFPFSVHENAAPVIRLETDGRIRLETDVFWLRFCYTLLDQCDGAKEVHALVRSNLQEREEFPRTNICSSMLSRRRNGRNDMIDMIKVLRFLSLIGAALVLGLTLTHDLEIPGKHLLSGADWLTVQHTFYGGFALVGGMAEVLGLISTGLLAFLIRKQLTAFILTLVASLCFAGMLVLFAFVNQPINLQVVSWTPQTMPANWRTLRDAWDGLHAASSLLSALSFVSLLLALLRETPKSSSHDPAC
jgi:hypothetical protein